MNSREYSDERLLAEWRANVTAARAANDPQAVMAMIPYSGFIGGQVKLDNDRLLYWLEKR